MRRDSCREIHRHNVYLFFADLKPHRLFRRIAILIALVSGTIGVMPRPAMAELPYCTQKGVDEKLRCMDERAPQNASARDRIRFGIEQESRCNNRGHAAKAACEQKPWMVTNERYVRCDQDHCWDIVDTVAHTAVCVRGPRSRLFPDGTLHIKEHVLTDGEHRDLSECPDEMREEFKNHATGHGSDILPVTTLVALSCLIGDPNRDASSWDDHFCYGMFKVGGNEVCGRVRKEKVHQGLTNTADRFVVITFPLADCPPSVRESRRIQQQNSDQQQGGSQFNNGGGLTPQQGTSTNTQSTVTGITSDTLPAPSDLGNQPPVNVQPLPGVINITPPLIRAPPPASAPQIVRQPPPSVSTAPQQAAPQPGQQGTSNNTSSTVTGTNTNTNTATTTSPTSGPPSSQPAGPSAQPNAATNLPRNQEIGPGGVKLDAQSKGQKADLSAVRGGVLKKLDEGR
jgi:hypothetical protein